VGRNSRPMFWLPGQNTTIGMPTPLNGHGRIRRCVDGSPNMPPEFSAGFHAGDTSTRDSPELARPALRRGRGNRRSRLELGFSRGRTVDARYGPGVRVLAGSCPTSRRILWIVGVRGGTWRKRVRRQAVLLMLLTLTQRFRRLSMAA